MVIPPTDEASHKLCQCQSLNLLLLTSSAKVSLNSAERPTTSKVCPIPLPQSSTATLRLSPKNTSHPQYTNPTDQPWETCETRSRSDKEILHTWLFLQSIGQSSSSKSVERAQSGSSTVFPKSLGSVCARAMWTSRSISIDFAGRANPGPGVDACRKFEWSVNVSVNKSGRCLFVEQTVGISFLELFAISLTDYSNNNFPRFWAFLF